MNQCIIILIARFFKIFKNDYHKPQNIKKGPFLKMQKEIKRAKKELRIKKEKKKELLKKYALQKRKKTWTKNKVAMLSKKKQGKWD